MTSLAIGHYLRLYNDGGAIVHAFQNFFIGSNVSNAGVVYSFVPFGFSGTSANRQAEQQPMTLAFPNNELARGYLDEALRGRVPGSSDGWAQPYVAEVDVNLLDPAKESVTTTMLTYVGQCTAGGWDTTQVTMSLSSVLDSVKGDVPSRTLHRRLVGSLPTTGNIRLR